MPTHQPPGADHPAGNPAGSSGSLAPTLVPITADAATRQARHLDDMRILGPAVAAAISSASQPHHGADSYNDAVALKEWLDIFSLRSQNTFRSYRREALRFRMFLHALHGNSPFLLRDATERDVQCYQDALAMRSFPLPAQAAAHAARSRLFTPDPDNPGWSFFQPGKELLQAYGQACGNAAPFRKPVSESSRSQALIVLNALFEFWREPCAGRLHAYVNSNPVRRVRRTRSYSRAQSDRYVPEEAIRAMSDMTLIRIRQARAELAQEPDSQRLQEAVVASYRLRWIFSMLFGLWVRRAEAVSINMGDFRRSLDGWSVTFTRKGGKQASLPVPQWVIKSLQDYRISLGLPESPAPDDAHMASMQSLRPAIGKARSKTGNKNGVHDGDSHGNSHGSHELPRHDSSRNGISVNTLYLDIKTLASQTAQALRTQELDLHWPDTLADLDQEHRAHRKGAIIHKLDAFSPHWFRHSGATIGINSGRISSKNASKMLSHANEHTTSSMYHHVDPTLMRSGVESMGSVLGSQNLAAPHGSTEKKP